MRKAHLRGRGPHFPILDRVNQYEAEPGYVVFMMPSPKRLRIKVGDIFVADTIEGMVMYESDHLPVYYFPMKDVREEFLMISSTRTESPFKGVATHYSLNTGITLVEDAGWRYLDPVEGCPPIEGYIAFYWNKMNHWYEEDEEVFVHARDPYRRIDTLPSSRHVEIYMGGERVADTRRATFLFETGLNTRIYMPIADARLDLFRPSRYISRCPYKGIASYYHLEVGGKRHDNVVWYYPDPVHEAGRIKGLVSFYDEFVDKVVIDGVEQPKPISASSHGYY
jgi:uncharacterized protein (DUF427 family)